VGSHSALFLAFNPNSDRVWHIGGNESGDRICRPDLHQCGTSAVFISPQPRDRYDEDEDDYYHDMVGLNWWMERQ